MIKQLVLLNALLISVTAFASSPDYYTVHDDNVSASKASIDPLQSFTSTVQQAVSEAINLMNWDHHNQTLEDPTVPYNRKTQYGTWVTANDGTCQNTRAKVLMRQSQVPVTFNDGGCTVVNGQWQDPYSDQQYTQASDLQIDHVVPLKNSYMNGGWQWDAYKRCLYANFLANDFHLLAVNGHDNMKKGDNGPDQFMPENQAFSCKYLSIWLKIKLIWNLALPPSEAQAIEQLAQQNHCDTSALSMAAQDLRSQRQFILTNMNFCKASE